MNVFLYGESIKFCIMISFIASRSSPSQIFRSNVNIIFPHIKYDVTLGELKTLAQLVRHVILLRPDLRGVAFHNHRF